MVSQPSLDYEPEDDAQHQYTPAETLPLTPHLDDFTQPANELDHLKNARALLDELLEMSCEVPLHEVNDMAEDSGVKTSEILQLAEQSDSCFIDWFSGHIRCSDSDQQEQNGYTS